MYINMYRHVYFGNYTKKNVLKYGNYDNIQLTYIIKNLYNK